MLRDQLDKLSILVTGGAGFMGSHFIKTLLNASSFEGKIINFDKLTYAGNLSNLRELSSHPRYAFVRGDVCNTELVKEICREHQIDLIVHFAAETHVDRSISSPHQFVMTNVLGTQSLLEIVRELKSVHFHHISTDEIYGTRNPYEKADEKAHYRPSSPYAASKASSDLHVLSYIKTYGISATLSRSSNNYGPCQFPEKLIPLVIYRCLQKKSIPLYGNGKQMRDWLYVSDHSRAIVEILKKGKSGETYNVGTGICRTNVDVTHAVIQEFCQILGADLNEYLDLITFIQDRPGHDICYALDTTKLQWEIGWFPKCDFAEGIRNTVKWYLEHRSWFEEIGEKEYHYWVEKQYSMLNAP